MTYEQAELIQNMPFAEGVRVLESLGCIKDIDGIWSIDGFDFFRCFEDSPTLYFEY